MQFGVAKHPSDAVVIADFAKRGAVKLGACTAGPAFRARGSAADTRNPNSRLHSVTEGFW